MKIATYPHDQETIKIPTSLAGRRVLFLPLRAEIIDGDKENDVTHVDWILSECVKHPFILDLSNFKGEK